MTKSPLMHNDLYMDFKHLKNKTIKKGYIFNDIILTLCGCDVGSISNTFPLRALSG